MSEADRVRWDRSYGEGAHSGEDPPAWLDRVARRLPRAGRALDIAAGAGRVACWLAARGLTTLAVDVSSEGLGICAKRAAAAGLVVETRRLDLESEPMPGGPFDVITCFHYLQRELFSEMAGRLAPGGWLICEIKTLENLERHAKPSARFLLEAGELRRLCADLEVVDYEEAWIGDVALAHVAARSAD